MRQGFIPISLSAAPWRVGRGRLPCAAGGGAAATNNNNHSLFPLPPRHSRLHLLLKAESLKGRPTPCPFLLEPGLKRLTVRPPFPTEKVAMSLHLSASPRDIQRERIRGAGEAYKAIPVW